MHYQTLHTHFEVWNPVDHKYYQQKPPDISEEVFRWTGGFKAQPLKKKKKEMGGGGESRIYSSSPTKVY